MSFPYQADNSDIHVEACYTTPGGIYYKCPFCFTCKNGTGPTGYDTYNTPLTESGNVAKHRINAVHIHGNLCRTPGAYSGYVAEKGRGDADNWVDGPKSPHCVISCGIGHSWQSHHPNICNNNVYIHVTENTRRYTTDKNLYPKNERYLKVLMPNFIYPTLKNPEGESRTPVIPAPQPIS